MISEEIKPLKLIGQAAEFKIESKFGPLRIVQYQRAIEGFDCKINCQEAQAFGAALQHSIARLDWQEQTQGVS